jgi:uncharacterized Zn finger protein
MTKEKAVCPVCGDSGFHNIFMGGYDNYICLVCNKCGVLFMPSGSFYQKFHEKYS